MVNSVKILSYCKQSVLSPSNNIDVLYKREKNINFKIHEIEQKFKREGKNDVIIL